MKAQKVYTVPVKARTLQRALDTHVIPSRRLEGKVARLIGGRRVVFTVLELSTLMMVIPGSRRTLLASIAMLAAILGG